MARAAVLAKLGGSARLGTFDLFGMGTGTYARSVSKQGEFLIRLRLITMAAFACAAAALPTGVFAQASPSPAATIAPKNAPTPIPAPSPSPSPTPVPHLIQYAAFSDVGYTSVGGTDVVRFVNGAQSRVFDGGNGPFFDSNGGRLIAGPNDFNRVPNLQNLNLQVTVNSAGPLGAKLEGSFGTDADFLASNGQSRSGANLTQAYLQYATGPLTVIAGKFSGLAGYEVAETINNTNFSRDYLYAAVMSTVTGVRATYAYNPKLSLIVGANNGWDDWKFVGKKRTYEGSLAITPSPGYSVNLTAYNGSDFLVNGASPIPPIFSNRMLYDGILTVHATSALTLVANVDNATQLGSSLAGLPSQHWAGIAGYANYQINPKYGVSLRKETFRDAQGFRTGVGTPLRLQTNTATVNYTPAANYIFRLEYRLDASDGPNFAFRHAAGSPAAAFATGRNKQSSIGIEAVVKAP
ncbi:MAG: hypothetical protein NVSMB5_18080 [Candidatus Velthaea sp.]